MAMLYEEKIAKRFAKIKPDDFDFWAELDSALATAFFGKEKDNPADISPFIILSSSRFTAVTSLYFLVSENVSIAYIFVCYGMYVMKSTICTCLVPKVLFKLVSRADVEQALLVMEIGAKKDGLK